MDSSSRPARFDPNQTSALSGRGDSETNGANDTSSQRMVADRLTAALASGNLELLAHARKAFLQQDGAEVQRSPAEVKQFPADLGAQLERRSSARSMEPAEVSDDILRQEEEALRQAEVELERRRADVQAARKKAKEDAQRRAVEEARRLEEAEALRRAEAEEQRIAELLAVREKAAAAARERAQLLEQLHAELDSLHKAETEQRELIALAEARLGSQEAAKKLAVAKVEELSHEEQDLNATIEKLRISQEEQQTRIARTEALMRAHEEAYLRAKIEAELRAKKDEEQLAEIEALNDQLAVAAEERARKEQELNSRIEALRQSEAEQLRCIEETQARVRAHEEARQRAETEARVRIQEQEQRLEELRAIGLKLEAEWQERAEKEQSLKSELEALRQAEEEQLRRIEEAEARLRGQEEARQVARARVKQLGEAEQQIVADIEELRRVESERLNRIKEAEARLPGHEEAVRQAEAQARRRAEEELQRLSQLEAVCEKAQAEAEQRAVREQALKSRIEALRQAKEEPVHVISEVGVANQQPLPPEPLSLELEVPRLTSSVESNVKQFEITSKVGVDHKLLSLESPSLVADVPPATPSSESNEIPGLVIDTKNSVDLVPESKEIEFVTADSTADFLAPADVPASINGGPDHSATSAEQPASNGNDPSFSPEMVARLENPISSERAAALADLADFGGEDSFHLITKSFDDSSSEVRNAAARALYHLQPDLSASFTRALREASPERRRKIGAAIAGSGLAANAINSLSGEGRDRTYDAFSILFLMAKAGEVQPLMQAIGTHPDVEVRLTAMKLIALSNQHQVLPALRSLAARDNLPPDVQTAVMEGIYQLSSKARVVV